MSTRDIFPVHAAFKIRCYFAASFRLKRVAIYSSLTSSVEWGCCSCFKSEIVFRPICSSLISLRRGARALFLLGVGFYTNKIIIFVVLQSWRFYHCVYVRKEKLLIFGCACVHNFTAAVSRRALRFAYEISAQFCHSYTLEPRNKSSAFLLTSLAQNTELSRWNHGKYSVSIVTMV